MNVAGRDYGAPGSYFFPFTGKWKIPSTGQTGRLGKSRLIATIVPDKHGGKTGEELKAEGK